MENWFVRDTARETESRIKQEAEEKKWKQDAERNLKEQREKKKIQKEHDAKLKQEKERLQKEIEQESLEGLKETRKIVEGYNERKAAKEEHLERIMRMLKENPEKQTALFKNDGVVQVTESKEQLQKEQEELLREKELVADDLNRLYEAKQEGVKENKKMKAEMREKEMEDVERQKKEEIELAKQLGNIKVDGEKRLNALAAEHAKFQKAIAGEHGRVQAAKIDDGYALINAQAIEQKHENFRRCCRGMIGLYDDFKDAFDLEEVCLIITKDEIEQGIPVSMTPDFTSILSALRGFAGELETFSVDGSNEPETFEALRETVRDIANQLLTSINTTVSKINGYVNACKMPESVVTQDTEEKKKTSRVSMSLSESEEFEVLAGSPEPEKKLSPANMLVQKPYATAFQSFAISDLYDKIKKLIEDLSTEILKFNVRASTVFDDTLAIQSTPLSTRLQVKERLAQIDSSSTARAAALEY